MCELGIKLSSNNWETRTAVKKTRRKNKNRIKNGGSASELPLGGVQVKFDTEKRSSRWAKETKALCGSDEVKMVVWKRGEEGFAPSSHLPAG